MRTAVVVVDDVVTQHVLQMAATEDQHPVQTITTQILVAEKWISGKALGPGRLEFCPPELPSYVDTPWWLPT